jgi:hypothetical protein
LFCSGSYQYIISIGRTLLKCVDIFHLKSSCLIIASITTLYKVAAGGSPCCNPDATLNFSFYSLLILALTLVLIRVNSISLSNFAGTIVLNIIPIYRAKSLCVVNRCNMQIYIMFTALFKHYCNYKYIVSSRSIWTKSHLKFF